MKRFSLVLPLGVLLLVACGKKDDPIIENEEEIITNVVLVLTPVDSGDLVTLSFTDPDGDGSQPGSTEVSGPLSSQTTYDGVLTLSNQSDPGNPIDITEEIVQESADHQFYYLPSTGLEATFTYRDSDGNGDPIGLLTELQTGGLSSGTLEIILRHEPDKSSAATISDPTGAGGETDITVSFPVSIAN